MHSREISNSYIECTTRDSKAVWCSSQIPTLESLTERNIRSLLDIGYRYDILKNYNLLRKRYYCQSDHVRLYVLMLAGYIESLVGRYENQQEFMNLVVTNRNCHIGTEEVDRYPGIPHTVKDSNYSKESRTDGRRNKYSISNFRFECMQRQHVPHVHTIVHRSLKDRETRYDPVLLFNYFFLGIHNLARYEDNENCSKLVLIQLLSEITENGIKGDDLVTALQLEGYKIKFHKSI